MDVASLPKHHRVQSRTVATTPPPVRRHASVLEGYEKPPRLRGLGGVEELETRQDLVRSPFKVQVGTCAGVRCARGVHPFGHYGVPSKCVGMVRFGACRTGSTDTTQRTHVVRATSLHPCLKCTRSARTPREHRVRARHSAPRTCEHRHTDDSLHRPPPERRTERPVPPTRAGVAPHEIPALPR